MGSLFEIKFFYGGEFSVCWFIDFFGYSCGKMCVW